MMKLYCQNWNVKMQLLVKLYYPLVNCHQMFWSSWMKRNYCANNHLNNIWPLKKNALLIWLIMPTNNLNKSVFVCLYKFFCVNMNFYLQKMGQMGQNSGLEMCAFFQIGQQSHFRDFLGLDEKARSIQNWELNCLQLQ